MSACLSEKAVWQYVTGDVSADDRRSVEEHLAACRACRERVASCRADEAFLAELQNAAGRQRGRSGGSGDPNQRAVGASPPDDGSSLFDDQLAPVAIEGYEILREIRRGGQGVVYEAVQESTKRTVAVKVMHGGPFVGRRGRARFRREVEILGQLQHPNIVAIHDSGTVTGSFFYVMDYVPGRSLDDHVASVEPSIDDTLRAFAKICDAVNAAHLRGIIHRDLKPSNVLMDGEGEPRILDFGLAKSEMETATDDSRPQVTTMTGQFFGSLPWASPEQAEAIPSRIDLRTDVYSLGVMLYQALTGRFPYEVAGAIRDVMDNILYAEPTRPSSIRRDIDDEVETIVLKALSKDRERRYQSAGEMGRDIHHYLAGEPLEAKRDSGWYVLRKTLARHKLPVGIAAAFIVLLVGFGLAVSVLYARAERNRQLAWQNAEKATRSAQAARTARDRESEQRHEAEKRLDAAYLQAFDKYVSDAPAQALVARAALDHARDKTLGDGSIRSWEARLRSCLGDWPRLAGSTPVVRTWCDIDCSPTGGLLAAGSAPGEIVLWDLTTGQVKARLSGHDGTVWSVRFSPDGRMLASGSDDHAVMLWDTSTGQLEATLLGHEMPVAGVSFSPDGRTLASCSDDRTVRLWDISTGRLSRTLSGHERFVTGVSFSPDGRTLASGSGDRTIRLWDVSTGQAKGALSGSAGRTSCVRFGPNGRLLAAVCGDKTIKLWDLSTGTVKATLQGHRGFVWDVRFSPDGEIVASGSHDATIKLWGASTGQLRTTWQAEHAAVTGLSFSSNGETLASASTDGSILLWNVTEGRIWARLNGQGRSAMSGVAFGPSGRTLTSARRDGTIELWNTVSGELVTSFRAFGRVPMCLTAAPDGRMLAIGYGDCAVRLWDVEAGRLKATLKGHECPVTCVRFGPGGKILASGSGDRTARVWDVSTGKARLTLRGHASGLRCVDFSPDGRILASGSADTRVRLWDVATGQCKVGWRAHGAGVASVAFSSDGRTLATGSMDNTVKLWEAATGQLNKTLRGHRSHVLSVSFAPDGRVLASGSADGRIRLWDVDVGETTDTLRAHGIEILSLAFSPGGRALASASRDTTVKLWDLGSSRSRSVLRGYKAVVPSVHFSPDGRTVAAGSLDKTITLWDVATGQPKATFRGHRGVSCVRFSPDGRMVAGGSSDATVRLWGVRTGKLDTSLKGKLAGSYCVCFSPDGRRLAAGGDYNDVGLWDVASRKLVATCRGGGRQLGGLCFSPDGRTLAHVSVQGGTVELRDATTLELQATLAGNGEGSAYSVAFSPDARMVAAGCGTGVRLWDVSSSQVERVLRGHDLRVSDVSFSPDGQTLASSSADNTIRLWDVKTFELKATLWEPSEGISSVVFSPDGQMLASGSGDGTVRLWRVPSRLLTRERLEHLTGAGVVDLNVRSLPGRHYCGEASDLIAVPGSSFPRQAGRPSSQPQRRLMRLRWGKGHPFRWIGAAKDPKDPAHAEACYHLGVLAEQDMKWDQAKQWHQKAIDPGPSKWADEARWRLTEMPARIRYLRLAGHAAPPPTISSRGESPE